MLENDIKYLKEELIKVKSEIEDQISYKELQEKIACLNTENAEIKFSLKKFENRTQPLTKIDSKLKFDSHGRNDVETDEAETRKIVQKEHFSIVKENKNRKFQDGSTLNVKQFKLKDKHSQTSDIDFSLSKETNFELRLVKENLMFESNNINEMENKLIEKQTKNTMSQYEIDNLKEVIVNMNKQHQFESNLQASKAANIISENIELKKKSMYLKDKIVEVYNMLCQVENCLPAMIEKFWDLKKINENGRLKFCKLVRIQSEQIEDDMIKHDK